MFHILENFSLHVMHVYQGQVCFLNYIEIKLYLSPLFLKQK